MEPTKASLIGPSIVIRGRVSARAHSLKVQGRIEGTLELDDVLIIDPDGVVDASMVCREAKIAGQLSGNVYATEKASIASSGRVAGAVFAPVFSVLAGARLDGTVEMDTDSKVLEEKFRAVAGDAFKGPTALTQANSPKHAADPQDEAVGSGTTVEYRVENDQPPTSKG